MTPRAESENAGEQVRAKGRYLLVKRFINGLQSLAATLTLQPHRYQSRRRLFGLPLLSIDVGPETAKEEMRHAKGIIAIGTKATGIVAIGVFAARGVFAIGFLTMSLAGVSIAGIGLLTVSGFGLGRASVAAIAIGDLAVGVLAVGIKALGVIAIGADAVGIVAVGKVVRTLFTLRP
jgi:hypothetical protein